MIDKILLMGPQGSGKGTQAEKLSAHLGIPAFAMGQLIRDEVATGSAYGRKLEEIINVGDLVSDTDAAGLLKLRLERPDTQNGYILDGYPRNLSQYAAFDFDTPTHVIVIDVPRDESLKRVGGRLTCRGCGRVASIKDGIVKSGGACACGGEWYQRDDDTPEAIERRLEIYEKDTSPVIEKYNGLVKHVDGLGSVEEVFERILKVL
ncbi:MAG: nucleoside monophosphate kinase [Candidatus Uhrbacteria bacterium]|nr:nucleoside monophosphate kinase [Candidatus Uhrbacteria bacterium]